MTDDFDINIDVDEVVPDVKPTLYDINQSFDVIKTDRYSGIRGEHEARMVLFTNFILGEKPVILKGSRASGKTNIMEIVGVYAKVPVVMASSSEKAYQRNKDLNKATHFVIPEVNKINEKTVDMLKDFGEGAKHHYTFLNAYKEPETILLEPKPFVTSIADENKNVNLLGDELMSRLTVVRTDSSVTQNIAVIEEKLRRAETPFYRKGISQDKVNKFIAYVKSIPSITRFGFIYPGGTVIRTAIPSLFTDSRRDTDKYLANTYGITLFHYYDRMKVVLDHKDYLLVTPIDMWYNDTIYRNVLLDSSLKCGKIEQEILDIVSSSGGVKQDDWGNKVKGLKISDIHTELLKRSYTPTIDSINKYCTQLTETGYLVRNEELRPYRFSLNPELHREYKVSINWEEVVEQCKKSVSKNFPEIADEYISRFCEGNGLIATNPFTGEQVNILTKKEVIIEKKKESSVPTQQEQPTIDESPVDFQVGLTGIEDEKDVIQREIMDILDDGEPHEFIELATGHDDNMVSEVLDYLVSITEIFKKGADKYMILK